MKWSCNQHDSESQGSNPTLGTGGPPAASTYAPQEFSHALPHLTSTALRGEQEAYSSRKKHSGRADTQDASKGICSG